MTRDFNADYSQVAWCTDISPNGFEYFKELKDSGVDAAIVTLRVSGDISDNHSIEQVQAARNAGMLVHAGIITDLEYPEDDADELMLRMRFHGFSKTRRIAIMVVPDPDLDQQTERLRRLISRLCNWCDVANIDVCLTKRQFIDGDIDLSELPAELNLTVSNPGHLDAGVATAGTWLYTNQFYGYPQLLGYDFYQFYTEEPRDRGYQMDLIGEYEALPGDSWWIIAKKHGMSLLDLLELNKADLDDRIFPGERIKVN